MEKDDFGVIQKVELRQGILGCHFGMRRQCGDVVAGEDLFGVEGPVSMCEKVRMNILDTNNRGDRDMTDDTFLSVHKPI